MLEHTSRKGLTEIVFAPPADTAPGTGPVGVFGGFNDRAPGARPRMPREEGRAGGHGWTSSRPHT
ncbi:hypothetical protein [Streptomyces sp. NPDC002990]